MLCLAGMLLYTNPAYATPFPDKTDQVIQDEDNYLKKEEKTSFANAMKEIPGSYKVVVVESTSPEAETPDSYAQKLYDNYNLPDDALMVVLDINTAQLGVYAGPALQKKGATMELLHDKVTSYFEPFRNQKKYVTGIQTFIGEVNAELDRIQNKQGQMPAASDNQQASAVKAEEDKSVSGGIPWWIYGVGVIFALLSVGLIYAMIRRRSLFAQVDDVEDWKDELLEKINVIEVEKSMRRSSGLTEERYHMLADKKENLLRIRIPDVETMILDAEEACDRFRFSLASGMLEEARENLTQIEQELGDLKADTSKVAVTKQENKVVVPEIGKLVEQVERRLSDLRLEYGLSFHELKSALDEVETMRSLIKTAQAAGDDVHVYETTTRAQQLLEQMVQSMEQIPVLVDRVNKEMPEEFRQLEEGIDQAAKDGFDLVPDGLDQSLLQAKQLLTAARNALEEGSIHMVNTHVKAFEVLLDATYEGIEDSVLSKHEAAATNEPQGIEGTVLAQNSEPESFERSESKAALLTEQEVAAAVAERLGESAVLLVHNHEDRLSDDSISQAERDVLLNNEAQEAVIVPESSSVDEPAAPVQTAQTPAAEEEEYELVIPKRPHMWEENLPEAEPDRLVIETEDDALDELERISGALIRIRQQIKRSYLPGIPDQLKYMFEEVVQTLSRIQAMMEQYRYDLEEVAILITDADELVDETERMAERIISTCQLAEGAIQYTNRYRRQNRQVNEMLTRAENSFRQLAFAEAYQLAEDARLIIEGTPAESDTRWLLRRKKKG